MYGSSLLSLCAECQRLFRPGSNRAKYCPACAAKVHRRQKAASERRRRASGVDNLQNPVQRQDGSAEPAAHKRVGDALRTNTFLYAVLLDRANLSRANGWMDEDGNIYIVFPLNKIADLVDKGPLNRQERSFSTYCCQRSGNSARSSVISVSERKTF